MLAGAAAAGDDSAAASAAELSAYLWRWDDVIVQAGRLIANPLAVYAGNVFHDLVLLLGRAGRETGDWRAVARAADTASQRIEADIAANRWGFPDTKLQAMERTHLLWLGRLGEYALGEGSIVVHGDLDVFAPGDVEPNREDFDFAMRLKRNHEPARRLYFACSCDLDDEMIRLCNELGDQVGFDQAVPVAKAHLRAGDSAAAWRVLRANWSSWAPVDWAQVAPLELLNDEGLSGVVTQERAGELVRTARAAHLQT